MQIHYIDIAIIILYLVSTILIGFLISKRASKGLDAYFLGDKSIPWYILGISNASGMFDITGTMWLVSMCFVYGLKSAWLPWIWPMFNQIFLMVYLSAWLRRSNVMTGAEWLETRFGNGQGARLSHIIIVIFAIVSVIGFIAYGFKGIGKFASTFLPWDLTFIPGISNEDTYALLFLGITTLYVVKGGMYSVVLTELVQFVIMTIASIAVGVIAMIQVSPNAIDKVIPDGWKELFFGWQLQLDWSALINSVHAKIEQDGFGLFTIFVSMMLFKGVLTSMAGPVPNYDMQRILATKSPKEAAMMSGLVSLVLYIPRFMLVAGLTVLALVYLSPELKNMAEVDFELILPYTLNNFIPTGLVGILLAGLLAAFMSTFAATVNAAPAYLVNDIYKKYINPQGDSKTYIRMSYLASIAVVIVGIAFGFVVESINSITQWIFAALFGGYTAANLLKWYWWRFNGHGYFWGMLGGLLASLATPQLFPHLQALYAFPFILILSLIGSIAGTLLTPPDDEEVLKQFYIKVKPWGYWEPIHQKIIQENPDFQRNTNFTRDIFNVFIGIIWQLSQVVIPIYLVIKEIIPLIIGVVILIITSIILKKNWLEKLEN